MFPDKAERISDPEKLRNVRTGISTPHAALERTILTSEDLDRLTSELRAVMQVLWDVEEGVRDCERAGDFGPLFVEFAHSVYKDNEHRAGPKRQINLRGLGGSPDSVPVPVADNAAAPGPC
jgi:hypothetical protein